MLQQRIQCSTRRQFISLTTSCIFQDLVSNFSETRSESLVEKGGALFLVSALGGRGAEPKVLRMNFFE
jgi:hypothetical protein